MVNRRNPVAEFIAQQLAARAAETERYGILSHSPLQALPEYQSHKKVKAAKIAAIEIHHDMSATITPEDRELKIFRTPSGWADRFEDRGGDNDLGYFVMYEDGYTSWSPTEAFEQGYTKADNIPRDRSLPIRHLQKLIHRNAINHGWWETERPKPEILCLIHSEVSEALEAYRNHDDKGFAEELADIAIRLLDAAEGYGIDLGKEIIKKHQVNVTREYRHGNKAC